MKQINWTSRFHPLKQKIPTVSWCIGRVPRPHAMRLDYSCMSGQHCRSKLGSQCVLQADKCIVRVKTFDRVYMLSFKSELLWYYKIYWYIMFKFSFKETLKLIFFMLVIFLFNLKFSIYCESLIIFVTFKIFFCFVKKYFWIFQKRARICKQSTRSFYPEVFSIANSWF